MIFSETKSQFGNTVLLHGLPLSRIVKCCLVTEMKKKHFSSQPVNDIAKKFHRFNYCNSQASQSHITQIHYVPIRLLFFSLFLLALLTVCDSLSRRFCFGLEKKMNNKEASTEVSCKIFHLYLLPKSSQDVAVHIGPEIELTFVFIISMHHLHIAVKMKCSVFFIFSMRYQILLIWTDIGF